MLYYNQAIETLPVNKLRRLQDELLQAQVASVYHHVPFYKKLLDEKGIKPGDIKGVGDLHLLPFTTKTDLRDNYPFGLFTMPVSELRRIHCSSGTTGKPVVTGYTRNDLEIFSEVVARSLVAAGCQPGMKLHNAYGYGLFTGGLGLHYGAERLGMTVIPVSGGMTERQILLLQDFGSEVICCTPSYALTIADEMKRKGIDKSSLKLQYAILGAEPWTESIRSEVEAGLNVSATNIYGIAEIIGPGVSQEDFEEKGTGSYIWEDHFFPEIVDKDTGEPLPEGEYGVLVFTTLTREAMPVLRYWTNDITNIYYDKSAKRTHIKMGPIKGRADDMLIIRGVNLFHTQVEVLLQDYIELSPNYQLIVHKEGSRDEVTVKVELEYSFYRALDPEPRDGGPAAPEILEIIRSGLQQRIKDNIGLNIPVTLVSPNAIPRSDGSKVSHILDLRKK